MKNLIFIFIVSLLSLQATTIQTTFQVNDENGSTVPGAQVHLNGKPVGVTDADGMIILKGLQKGDAVIFYHGDRYEPFEYIVTERNPKTVQEIVLVPYSIILPGPDAIPVQDSEEIVQDSEEIYTIVDELVEFPDGIVAMSKYISNKIVYPAIVAEKNLQGKCVLQFVVEKDGSITNIKILRGIPDCPDCDNAAVRVVKGMPKWKPGQIQGRPVRSYYTLPVTIHLK